MLRSGDPCIDFDWRITGDSVSSSARCRSHASTIDDSHGIDLVSRLSNSGVYSSSDVSSYRRFRRSRSARNVRSDRARILSATLASMMWESNWLRELLIHQFSLNQYVSVSSATASILPRISLISFRSFFIRGLGVVGSGRGM